MAGRRSSGLLLVAVLAFAGAANAQRGETFAYTGEDALRSGTNTRVLNYGGLANNLLVADGTVLFPYLPTIFYEAGYLLTPPNGKAALSVSAMPELFLSPWFMGRVMGLVEANFMGEAQTHEVRAGGFRAGIGYAALGSTFGVTGNTPVVRAGFLVGSIRVTYTYSLAQQVVLNHQMAVALKFDW